MSIKVRILFLGASKRVSLFERFFAAAESENITLELFSCESKDAFYPISKIATVLVGPKFKDINFETWLLDIIVKYSIDIVIPNMDSATVALSRVLESRPNLSSYLVVSSRYLCETMEDKILAADFFKSNKLPVVENEQGVYPKILKLRKGFGSKDVYRVDNEEEFYQLCQRIDLNDFIMQNFIVAKETTVDMHISKSGELIGYVLRDRIEISDGEVMTCETRLPSDAEKLFLESISKIKGWVGCITIQYFTDERGRLYLNEINPRFGGGVTCSIEAGLDFPRNILREFFSKKVLLPTRYKSIIMTRARRDFFYEK